MNKRYITQSCTGCYESEDGHPVGEYPFDEKARCFVGSGCRECGYTGKRRWYYNPDDFKPEPTPPGEGRE